MAQVARYDVAQVRKPEITSQGFLRADAILTRSGIFRYRNPDGTVRSEYRPPEEVFKTDALASFEDAPVTNLHPDRMVTKDNASKVSVGYVKESPRRDGDMAVARVLITDAAAIAEVQSGRKDQVSCGYLCDYDPTPGVTPDGQRYDGVQRNIQGNHLALVPVGRAGPDARIRLDSGDAVLVTDPPSPTPTPGPSPRKDSADMAKVRLDGVDFEASEQLAQAISVAEQKNKARVDELQAELEKAKKTALEEKARADAAKDDAEKAKKEREDALKPEAIQDRIKARLDMERVARRVLGEKDADGKEIKLDAMTDEQIRKAVIVKVHPGAKERLDAEDVDEVYLKARYDAAIESLGKDQPRNDGMHRLRSGLDNPSRQDNDPIQKARQDEADRWKKPLQMTTRRDGE